MSRVRVPYSVRRGGTKNFLHDFCTRATGLHWGLQRKSIFVRYRINLRRWLTNPGKENLLSQRPRYKLKALNEVQHSKKLFGLQLGFHRDSKISQPCHVIGIKLSHSWFLWKKSGHKVDRHGRNFLIDNQRNR